LLAHVFLGLKAIFSIQMQRSLRDLLLPQPSFSTCYFLLKNFAVGLKRALHEVSRKIRFDRKLILVRFFQNSLDPTLAATFIKTSFQM
jgi:hypothetical protein